MEGTPDIAKIVSMIMQNPELIEAIRTMVSTQDGSTEEKPTANAAVSAEGTTDENDTAEQLIDTAADNNPAKEVLSKRKRRNTLLHALKPYVSKERARAIDTMMSIADMLDAMKGV